MVAEQNVRLTVAEVRENSPILKDMEIQGVISIAGAVYEMDTGIVAVLEDSIGKAVTNRDDNLIETIIHH